METYMIAKPKIIEKIASKMPSPTTLVAIGAAVLAILLIWSLVSKFNRPAPGVAAPLPPAKEVRTIEKIITKVEYVKVYPNTVKPDLGLPAPVVKDDNKQVIATGKLNNAEQRDYTLSAVLDTKTGEAEVYARPDPLPWIGPGRQGAIGIAYNYKMPNNEWVGKLHGRYDFIQVKSFHGGVNGSIETDNTKEAGFYVEWRF